MGSEVNGMGQWEAAADQSVGGESGQGNSIFAETYCCLPLPAGDSARHGSQDTVLHPRVLRPKAAVEGKAMGPQRCPCLSLCNR